MTVTPALLLASFAAFMAAGTAARADSACGAGAAPLGLARMVAQKDAALAHVWGVENISVVKEAGVAGDVLRVAYPKGSFSPGSSRPRGGAGFELAAVPAGARRACLSYRVRFSAGFDFAKGGKLPGLFGGDNPRGCVDPATGDGFSTRLMWRTGGDGELYLYGPGRDTRCGKSIGRGSFHFTPGAWTLVTQKLVMSTPGAFDGSVEIWIDGKLAVNASGLSLAASPTVGLKGLFFSTFFGGADETWASPRSQTADFAEFVLTSGK